MRQPPEGIPRSPARSEYSDWRRLLSQSSKKSVGTVPKQGPVSLGAPPCESRSQDNKARHREGQLRSMEIRVEDRRWVHREVLPSDEAMPSPHYREQRRTFRKAISFRVGDQNVAGRYLGACEGVPTRALTSPVRTLTSASSACLAIGLPCRIILTFPRAAISPVLEL